MAYTNRTLDLNTARLAALTLTLKDDARTVVHLKMPSEGMVQELQNSAELLQGLSTDDRGSVEAAIYDLVARLLNRNSDFRTFAAADLPTVYNMDLEAVILFLNSYMDWIVEITNEKN